MTAPYCESTNPAVRIGNFESFGSLWGFQSVYNQDNETRDEFDDSILK